LRSNPKRPSAHSSPPRTTFYTIITDDLTTSLSQFSLPNQHLSSASTSNTEPRRTRDRTEKAKMDAPLSSPSLNGPSHPQTQHSYFSQGPSSSSTSSSSGPTSAPQQQPAAQVPPPQQRTDTSPFLRDFNLVAEAAKRAQMAVLMRDMEGVALSS
jgi:hypothetical protein